MIASPYATFSAPRQPVPISDCFMPVTSHTVASFRLERRYYFSDGTTASDWMQGTRKVGDCLPFDASPAVLAKYQEQNPKIERVFFRAIPVLTDPTDPARVAEFKSANRWLSQNGPAVIEAAPAVMPRRDDWSVSWSCPDGRFGWSRMQDCSDAGEALTAWLDECRGMNTPSDAQPDTIRRDR